MSHQILLADNNIQIQEALGDYLEELGFIVFRAATGKTAHETIQQQSLSIVILSLGLKNPSSKELFSLAIESTSSPQIILLAEEFQSSDVKKLATAGAFDYLTKPFSEQQFKKTVDLAITVHQAILTKARTVRQLLSKSKKLEALTVEQAKKLAELYSLREETSVALSEHDMLTAELDKLTLTLSNKEQTISGMRDKMSQLSCLPPLKKIALHRIFFVAVTSFFSIILLYPALLPGNIQNMFPAMILSGTTLSAFAFLLSMAFISIALYTTIATIRKNIYTSIEKRDESPRFIQIMKMTKSIGPALILLLNGYTLHFLYSGFQAVSNTSPESKVTFILGAHAISEATLSKGITLLMLSLILMWGIILLELVFLYQTVRMLYSHYSKKSSPRRRITSL